MNAMNLMNRMLKTVTLVNVKLTTPADRIGTGFMAVAMPPAAAFPVSGLSRQPQRSTREPEPGSRQQEVSAVLRYQPNAVEPTGTTRVVCVSGLNSDRNLLASAAWLLAKQANRLLGTPPMAGDSIRELHSGSHCSPVTFGRDCQSPDRTATRSDRKPAGRISHQARSSDRMTTSGSW
jgi:hypothetical protein